LYWYIFCAIIKTIDKYYKKYDENHQKFENYPKIFTLPIDDMEGKQ